MCEQTERIFLDGDVVWVKLGSCWWPGQVVGDDKVPPDVIQSFRKAPIAIVKFFQEDTFEYVRNINNIYKYQCSRKDEFIKKGIDMFRSKHGAMEKFPEDVIRAECHTDGDTSILNREEFQEKKKESYAGLFGDAKTPTGKKGRLSKTKASTPITPRLTPFSNTKRSSAYKVTYLVQESQSSSNEIDNSNKISEATEVKSPEASVSVTPGKTPRSGSGIFECHACPFTTSRLNVLIHHNKTHSSTFTLYKPSPIPKNTLKTSFKATPKSSKIDAKKTPKLPRPKKIKINQNKESEDKVKAPKRIAEEKSPCPIVKKSKTDEEIKNTLLADWEDEWGEEKEEENLSVISAEVPAKAESPAGPTSADCMAGVEVSSKDISHPVETNDVPEPSSDAKYDFCEDEDWPLEADVGRKIPRVKNLSKHKTDIQSLTNEDDDIAKEVTDLLEKTVVPELPKVPDVLKVEENFPDASIVKSPDKVINRPMGTNISPKKDIPETPTKTIFKTKTFFRSRHSRSQDAIEKYVAEQLQNHTEKINSLDCDINGSEVISSPEPRVSLPVEPVKVARLAPKIELKRMKAEAQLKEKILNELTAKSKAIIEPLNVFQTESTLKETMGEPQIAFVSDEKPTKVHDIQTGKSIVTSDNQNDLTKGETLERNLSINKLHKIQYSDPSLRKEEIVNTKFIAKTLNTELKPVTENIITNSFDSEKQIVNNALTQIAVFEHPTDNADIAPTESERVIKVTSNDPPDVLFEEDITTTEIDENDTINESNLSHENLVPIEQKGKCIMETELIDDTKEHVAVDDIFKEYNKPNPIEHKDDQVIIDHSVKEHVLVNILEENVPDPIVHKEKQVILDDSLEDNERGPREYREEHITMDTRIKESEPHLIRHEEEQVKMDHSLEENKPDPMQHREKPVIMDPSLEENLIKDHRLEDHELDSIKYKKERVILDHKLEGIEPDAVEHKEEHIIMDHSSEENQPDSIKLKQDHVIIDDTFKENKKPDPIEDKEEHVVMDHKLEENEPDPAEHKGEYVTMDRSLKENESDCFVHKEELVIMDHSLDENELDSSKPKEEQVIMDNISNEVNEFVPIEQKEKQAIMDHTFEEVKEPHMPIGLNEEHVIKDNTFVELNEPVPLAHKEELAIIDNKLEEHIKHVPIEHNEKHVIIDNKIVEHENSDILYTQPVVSKMSIDNIKSIQIEKSKYDEETDNLKEKPIFIDNTPSESDLQIAEALINLPTTHSKSAVQTCIFEKEEVSNSIQNQSFNNEASKPSSIFSNEQPIFFNEGNVEPFEQEIISSNGENIINKIQTPINTIPPVFSEVVLNQRFETEEEKSENLNAAQSLVQMSEQISETCEPKVSLLNKSDTAKNTIISKESTMISHTNVITENKEIKTAGTCYTNPNSEIVHKSKLLRILEEPIKKIPNLSTRTLLGSNKERNMGYDNVIPNKSNRTNQKVTLIRRKVPSKIISKSVIESPTENNIVLSKMKTPEDGSNIQTYTIQGTSEKSSDDNTIIIQQTYKRNAPNVQKLKSQSNIVEINKKLENKLLNVCKNDDALFDINSMPVVLSDDIVTAEDIEKMPFVMTDGNILPNTSNKPSKSVIKEVEAPPSTPTYKSEVTSRSPTPNIISKSTKGKGGGKPMLVIDKATGKQKIIVAPPETLQKEKDEIKPSQPEKFIILPQTNTRTNRTQKIIIDPQTGKAHMLIPKSSEPTSSDTKPVSAKLISSPADPGAGPSSTIMIITNAQGTQSKIVLTPEHEKILFPKKQRSNVTQLKTVAQQRPVGNVMQNQIIEHKQITQRQVIQKQIPARQIIQKQNTSRQILQKQTIISSVSQNATTKSQNKIVPKQQKSAIITSKGQLIVGGRLAATATSSKAIMPEIRPTMSTNNRIIISETIKSNKSQGEPLIFLQQKSGSIVQLTAAQFDHLQKTGQVFQKAQTPTPVIHENKIVIQKSITLKPGNSPIQKTKNRIIKSTKSPIPAKKIRHETDIISATIPSKPPISSNPMQSLLLTENAPKAIVSAYPELDNFEELLPSTAIEKKPEQPKQEAVVTVEPTPPLAPAPEPALPASISDGQLVAVPGENFGGPQGSFYLCIEDGGTVTPIDNRPLILENNQLVPMETSPMSPAQPERRDILEAALANSDVFHGEVPQPDVPDFRDLNANVSVHCRVSETSTTLNQPIMTPVEVPSKCDTETAVASTLEDGLAVIGVTGHNVPTSLELPITVTDPRIAPKTTDPLSNPAYCSTMLSPNIDMTYVDKEETIRAGSISMPLLSEDDGMGKSMPILTDDMNERTASSVESAAGSPVEGEGEEGTNWSRRLLTPGSDCSETSTEIPLQPTLQISVNDLHRDS